MKCACCGADMLLYQDRGKSVVYKCKECGLSVTRLKQNQDE